METNNKTLRERIAGLGIALLCFGYFAAYIPYSMLTKMVTSGCFECMNGTGLNGFVIQPIAVFGSLVGTFAFITFAGWWKFATHSNIMGVSVPRPQWFTLVSGICLSGQIITTTLAYTFEGVSIVFAMLLMRGGVLVMAPIVDVAARRRKRKIYWPSWVAAGLSLMALLVSSSSKSGLAMTVVCAVDIAIYLFVYFFRLLFMSNRAKSDDANEKKQYFVEEQMVANLFLFIVLFIVGYLGSNLAEKSIPRQIWEGFVTLPFSGYFPLIFIIGICSYLTGLFGTLIFLDKRENTFTVPANRSASVLAGVVSTVLLWAFYGQRFPDVKELIGVVLIIGAIVFLAYRSVVEKKLREKGGS